MVVSPRKHHRPDLEKIATQLASIRIVVVPNDERQFLRAVATFDTRSFDAGPYRVSVGLRQAILHLDLPAYDVENAYQATLPKETWSESWKHLHSTNSGIGIQAKIGARIASVFSLTGEGGTRKKKSESAEQKASAPYRIISPTPSGWRIGTELGDPRDPQGTLPDGLDHCLNGEYLSGKSGEHGEGIKEKSGQFALCELKPKTGANDPRVVATLFGVSGSLQIEIASPPTASLHSQGDKAKTAEALRKAFVEICLRRAESAALDGARTDRMLTGEFYLTHREIRAPSVPQTKTLEQNPVASSKAKIDAKRRET